MIPAQLDPRDFSLVRARVDRIRKDKGKRLVLRAVVEDVTDKRDVLARPPDAMFDEKPTR